MRISDWSSDVCSSDLLRAHHAADENEMIAGFVQRLALAFERDQRAVEQRHAGLAGRPGQVRKAVLALRREAVRRGLLSDLQPIDPEMHHVARSEECRVRKEGVSKRQLWGAAVT